MLEMELEMKQEVQISIIKEMRESGLFPEIPDSTFLAFMHTTNPVVPAYNIETQKGPEEFHTSTTTNPTDAELSSACNTGTLEPGLGVSGLKQRDQINYILLTQRFDSNISKAQMKSFPRYGRRAARASPAWRTKTPTLQSRIIAKPFTSSGYFRQIRISRSSVNKAVYAAGIGITAWSIYNNFPDYQSLVESDSKNVTGLITPQIGVAVGARVGAALGTTLGTTLGPAGGVIGSVIGSVAGSYAARALGRFISN